MSKGIKCPLWDATRTLIGEGCIFIYSCSAQGVKIFLNQIQIDQFDKKSVGQNMNI